MIGLLRGTIEDLQAGRVILDVQGVGYLVYVPQSFAQNHQLGQQVTLFTHLAVREDALTLYGFISDNQKELFELLVGVSGIGPRLGLAIVSAYSAEEIQSAIAQGNSAAFTAISGIGKKNADRIILELKNKVAIKHLDAPSAVTSNELHSAMAALGYSQAEIAKASMRVDGSLPLAEQIKQALASLNRNN